MGHPRCIYIGEMSASAAEASCPREGEPTGEARKNPRRSRGYSVRKQSNG